VFDIKQKVISPLVFNGVKPEVGLDYVVSDDFNNLIIFGGIENGLKLKISTKSPDNFTIEIDNKYKSSFGKIVKLDGK